MIVLTNCLNESADEGCLKVAVSLVGTLKKQDPQTMVIGYERQTELCDHYLTLNKMMLSPKLLKLLGKRKDPVLFIPFSAKMRSTALRTLMVSLFAPGRVMLLQSMFSPMGKLAKLLMKLSRAKMICLSESSYRYYRRKLGHQAMYMQAGVDMEKFQPSSPEKKAELREKYGLPQDKPVVLHVGHLKSGRNIGQFLKLDRKFQGVLVTSTHRPDQQEPELGEKLKEKSNLTLLQDFYPDIQEVYCLADVYFFPVEHQKSCIDVPLSALEAAACGIPVVTTAFGEMRTLLKQDGFYYISDFQEENLNALLQKAICEKKSPREAVVPYDWNRGAELLRNM